MPQEAPMQKIVCKLTKEKETRMKALFNTAFYVADEKLAFKKYPGLCNLQEKNGVDLGNMYRNDKACKSFVKNIAEVEEQNLVEELKCAQFFCVLADGSTSVMKASSA